MVSSRTHWASLSTAVGHDKGSLSTTFGHVVGKETKFVAQKEKEREETRTQKAQPSINTFSPAVTCLGGQPHHCPT